MTTHENEVIIRVEKTVLEKAADNAMVNYHHEQIKKEITDNYGQMYWVDRKSITNENNLIT